MTHVVGIGYIGSIEDLCERLCTIEDNLDDTLEDLGLIFFNLDDGQCFVTLDNKYQLVDDTCITLDYRTKYSPSELLILQETIGLKDYRIRICQLYESSLDDLEMNHEKLLDVLKDMKLAD